MTARDYKEIQDLQLCYETYVQCRRFDLIVNELFSRREDITYMHSQLAENICGQTAVRQFFSELAEKYEENGGFLRTDLSTSQVLNFQPDHMHATGIWLTIGVECLKEAYGNSKEPYPLYRVFGQRQTEFILEDGAWKILKTCWNLMFRLGPEQYDPAKCTGWSGMRDRRWELPPTMHSRPWEGRRCR